MEGKNNYGNLEIYRRIIERSDDLWASITV